MKQQRLNNLMVLHVYKESTSDLSEVDFCIDSLHTQKLAEDILANFGGILNKNFQFLQTKYNITTVERVVYYQYSNY